MMPMLLCAQVPSGAIAKYELNTNAVDFGGSSYNGTLTSAANTTNRFGNNNTALAFTAGSSAGTLPMGLVTAMQNNFSLGFWFKTGMVASSSTQWYGGNALVDAEVCGGTNDWGTALIDGGKVCFGVGNTDITIKSVSAGYNNNAWHFVTVTRNAAASTIILYVDGAAVASSGGINPGALSAPVLIGLARNPCNPSPVYTGSLDDIIAYNRVLTATEVSNMYVALSAFSLPLTWISFTADLSGNNVLLKWEVDASVNNDHFEIESSADGAHFAEEGRLPRKDGSATNTGRELYTFSSAGTMGSYRYYRIKQVDKDGSYAYTKIIKVLLRNRIAGPYLQTNPVTDELVLVNQAQSLIQRLQVTDMSGRLISDKQFNTNNALIKSGTQQLQPGYYLLRIITANGNYAVGLIKQ
ncbi:MAG: LamG-like jellyroll fold domain-containing protein [Chitinophagaceae bacterium]